MRQDVERIRTLRPDGKEHPIDRILDDGDEVTLGGTTLVAHRTAGHTQGCTSWALDVEENGQTYVALIVCSVGVNPGYILYAAEGAAGRRPLTSVDLGRGPRRRGG